MASSSQDTFEDSFDETFDQYFDQRFDQALRICAILMVIKKTKGEQEKMRIY